MAFQRSRGVAAKKSAAFDNDRSNVLAHDPHDRTGNATTPLTDRPHRGGHALVEGDRDLNMLDKKLANRARKVPGKAR